MSKTKEKYMNAMLYACAQPEFNSREFARAFKIRRWIGDKPTQAIAMAFAKECLKQSRISHAQSKAGTQQLTIKPIKRVERTQPAPIREEPICDNSNSKMFLIMAVGAAIGFLVATIIWK